MIDVLYSKIVVARQGHRCRWCGEKILRGDRYNVTEGVDRGNGFFRTKLHLECIAAVEEFHKNSWDDNFEPYIWKRGIYAEKEREDWERVRKDVNRDR